MEFLLNVEKDTVDYKVTYQWPGRDLFLLVCSGIDVKNYKSLVMKLKAWSKHHGVYLSVSRIRFTGAVVLVPKKSAIFTKEQVFKFLRTAPSTPNRLLQKVVLLAGYYGACRTDDLTKLTWDLICITPGEGVWGTLLKRKTGAGKDTFLMLESPNDASVCAVSIFENYKTLLKTPHSRLFMSVRHGRFTNNPLGQNTLRKIPQSIAQFLELQFPETFTGHCFRRTSATSLADSGETLLNLKRHGGWKSSSVAEGYLHNSKRIRTSIAQKLGESQQRTTLPAEHNPSVQKHPQIPPTVVHLNFTQCSGITFNGFPPSRVLNSDPNFETVNSNDY
jgi:integrase